MSLWAFDIVMDIFSQFSDIVWTKQLINCQNNSQINKKLISLVVAHNLLDKNKK